jgi:L-fucose isomerase-like protein
MEDGFSFDVACSPIHDDTATDSLLAGLSGALVRAGGQRRTTDAAPLDQALFHVVLTGGTERVVLERLAWREAAAGGEPAVLVSHPGHNSLPAALEILARVQRDGRVGRIVVLRSDADETGAAELRRLALLARVGPRLRTARIGAVGAPSDWLVASDHTPAVVRRSWGPEMVPIPLAELRARLADAVADPAVAGDLARGAARPREAADRDLGRSTALFGALRALASTHRLDALTLRCFDLIPEDGVTGCVALSLLPDQGLPAGCEGDVPSVVALLWLRLLTGAAAWMANPAWIDREAGELLLAHCTVPRTLVESYELETHFESGRGVAIGGRLPAGPVTLVRIGGASLQELFTCEGQLVSTPHVPQFSSSSAGSSTRVRPGLCRTQARVRVDPAVLDELLERPLGNHLLLTRGHRATLLRESHRLLHGAGPASSAAWA